MEKKEATISRFCLPCAYSETSRAVERTIDLECGCQDVVYSDGKICYEHDHVACDRAILPPSVYWG